MMSFALMGCLIFSGQQRQQKPVGSCLTFTQLRGTDGEQQCRQLDEPPQRSHPAGQPQHFQL